MLKAKLQQSEFREEQVSNKYQSELLLAEMSDDVMTGAHASAKEEVAQMAARESILIEEVGQARKILVNSNEMIRRAAESEVRMEASFQAAMTQAMADKDEMMAQCRVVSAKAGETYKEELGVIQFRAERMLIEMNSFSDAASNAKPPARSSH